VSKTFLQKLDAATKWGTDDAMNPIDQLHYQVVNTVCFIFLFSTLAAMGVHAAVGNWANISVHLTVLALNLPIFVFIKSKQIHRARIYLLTFTNGLIFIFSGQPNIPYDFHVIFFGIALLPFVLYSSEEKTGRILGTLLSTSLFFVLAVNNFEAPWVFNFPTATWSLQGTYAMTFAITFTAIWLLIRSHDLTLTFLDEERTRLINKEKLISLGELSSSLAHELKNPLAVIVSRTALLLERLEFGAVPPDDLVKALKVIHRTSGRIELTIKSVQSLSRDSTRDNLVPISIKVLIDDVMVLLDHKIKSKEVELRILDFHPGWLIMGRESQLVQVLMNLISNAVDAIENQDVRWVEIDFRTNAEFFAMIVRDSGSGIAPELVKKIMNPFFTTKTTGKGTGLGLSISRRIMQDHQGELVYVATDNYTEFHLQFPIKSLAHSTPQAVAA
jgi:signal transduction histidine kinase